jgi:hypothetical protein
MWREFITVIGVAAAWPPRRARIKEANIALD